MRKWKLVVANWQNSRERIRKAKATIKDADDALAADDKAREEAKKKK